jgi:GUN4-like/SEFIR domain
MQMTLGCLVWLQLYLNLAGGMVVREAKAYTYTKVFISYSWDSSEHKESVLQLANTLRAKVGVDADIDRYVRATPPFTPEQGWDLWMQEKLEWAEFVIVVCTETYKRRFEGREEPGKGLGVSWEGTIIRQNLYNNQLTDTKFIPVVLYSSDLANVPLILNSKDKYVLDDKQSYTELCYRLRKQNIVVKPEIVLEELQLPPEPIFFAPQSSQKPSIGASQVFSNLVQTEDSIVDPKQVKKKEEQEQLEQKQSSITQYRKSFEEFVSDDGDISPVGLIILQGLQEELGLNDEIVCVVREEVLAPHKKNLDRYKKNLDRYKQYFTQLITEQEYPFEKEALNELNKMEIHFKLKKADLVTIDQEVGFKSLKRDGGIDYTRLHDLLVKHEWEKADQETWVVLCQVAGKQKEGVLDKEDIRNLPCEELQVINRLWSRLSGGRFGFSVQKKIYQKLNEIETELEKIKQFGRQVGWLKARIYNWYDILRVQELKSQRENTWNIHDKVDINADKVTLGFLPICIWWNLGTKDLEEWKDKVNTVESESDTRAFFGYDPDEPPFEMSAVYESIQEAKNWLIKEEQRILEKEKRGEREWEGITLFERLKNCDI